MLQLLDYLWPTNKKKDIYEQTAVVLESFFLYI